ncbi:MAG: ROK family protein [Saprospiraceae bacterium]|nr:ROK family protein [Saprospiraceae bacterium]MBK6564700.1 ROK family protein [Saprospiraceae bacterium]MBK6784776.1 ROK family protein [Saprospiraceae bacterium]MBK7523339.1 ROK family protein [Saprospiraceae bacterium]MBK8079442.1 ROK family protein [Saprospiraceae bacterium]
MEVLGIDVGATGIKGSIVDLSTGTLIGEKVKMKTPSPATPDSITSSIKQMIDVLQWTDKPVGIGFPSIVKEGVCWSASNIDTEFIGFPIQDHLEKVLNTKVKVVNDADAAGIAEMTFGKGKTLSDKLVIFITLGTGIGSAIFYKGVLVPNSELGHLFYKKSVFEKYASNSARELKGLGWKSWAKELNVYLQHLNHLFSPDVILIGGGVSKQFDKYKPYLNVECMVETAQLLNDAGIIGSAMSLRS